MTLRWRVLRRPGFRPDSRSRSRSPGPGYVPAVATDGDTTAPAAHPQDEPAPAETTDETATVDDGARAVGELLCARVVPTGERTQILGGVEQVDPDRLDAVLAVLTADDVEPEDVVDVLN